LATTQENQRNCTACCSQFELNWPVLNLAAWPIHDAQPKASGDRHSQPPITLARRLRPARPRRSPARPPALRSSIAARRRHARSADRPRCWPAPGPRIDRSTDGGRALRAWARWPPTAEREVMRLYAHAPVKTTSYSSSSTQFISKHNELTSKLFKSSDQILHTVSHESRNFVFVLYTSILLVTFICYFTSRIPGGSHLFIVNLQHI